MKIKGNTAVRVALIQMACSADPEQNFESAVKKLNEAADAGAQIVCLPELFRSQYFCQIEDHKYFALAEEIPGPSTDLLAVLAAARKITIVASLFERRAPGLYHNTAVVINARGELLGRYRKMHIPDDPLYYEKFYFTPGDTGFRSWKTEAAKIGVCICWDQWYPEAARLTALSGAQIIFYPTAIGWHPGEKEKYGKTQPRHCQWLFYRGAQSRGARGAGRWAGN
jgi:N-carbamoylputrescine amidase